MILVLETDSPCPGDTSYSPPKRTNVTVVTLEQQFHYDRFPLLLSYGLAILLALIGLVLGSLALLANGVSCEKSFSAVLRTTRNPELDKLMVERSWSVQPSDTGLGRSKLTFGVLNDGGSSRDGNGRVGFGPVGTVTRLANRWPIVSR